MLIIPSFLTEEEIERNLQNMFEFLILPHHLAKKVVEMRPGECNVISIEKDEHVDSKLCKNHLQLDMDDIQDWHIEKFDKNLKEKGIIYPEKKDIIKAIEFDKKCNHKIHIVHCHVGISRSPAVGYAILRSRSLNKDEAMKKVMEIAPNAIPNQRIIRLTDELFN